MIKPNDIIYTSIDGVMDEKTVEFHHGKHHMAYANTLNKLLEGTAYENWTLEDIITKFDTMELGDKKQAVINNAGGVYNHNLFFEEFSNTPKVKPEGKLAQKIEEDFGGLENLNKELIAKGTDQFGSGWSFLVIDNGTLKVEGRKNQDNPEMLDKKQVLLGIDVWEHSYYLMYQNLRPKYLEAAIKHIDWEVIEKRFEKISTN